MQDTVAAEPAKAEAADGEGEDELWSAFQSKEEAEQKRVGCCAGQAVTWHATHTVAAEPV